MTAVHMSSESDGIISSVRTLWDDSKVIHLTDGTVLELNKSDIEMLELAFESECEMCGYDPNEDPFEEDDDEEDEDDED